MSEAPKKLWFDIDDCSAGPVQFSDDEILYIRADIVNELVKAFWEVLRISDRDHEAWNKARAALKKMEKSHE